ncbi:hypothetical protein HCUR_01168 [Holospora curviuscula]|uniref:Uncharacterized protein n=1 Tax=Holospora curviuscula TaxID=1082868 RepID=A0A2S5R7S7_9PROT|nr:hypothetical protein HCUR_01168 [Holospora curviuscula]
MGLIKLHFYTILDHKYHDVFLSDLVSITGLAATDFMTSTPVIGVLSSISY